MSTTESQQFNRDRLGAWTDPVEFEVTQERIVEYAKATNDDLEPHASGLYAPPVFAVVPTFQTLAPTMAEVTPPDLLMRTKARSAGCWPSVARGSSSGRACSLRPAHTVREPAMSRWRHRSRSIRSLPAG